MEPALCACADRSRSTWPWFQEKSFVLFLFSSFIFWLVQSMGENSTLLSVAALPKHITNVFVAALCSGGPSTLRDVTPGQHPSRAKTWCTPHRHVRVHTPSYKGVKVWAIYRSANIRGCPLDRTSSVWDVGLCVWDCGLGAAMWANPIAMSLYISIVVIGVVIS